MKIINALRLLCALFVSAHALPIADLESPQADADVALAPAPPSNDGRIPATLSLPSNATAIRADITDTFSCDGKIYGYYADVDNDCQIFHICLPVTYADGKENMFRWSFVCPDETIFSQELFTCIRPADWSGNCSESGKFVELNRQFGATAASDEQQSAEQDFSEHSEVAAAAAMPAIRAPDAKVAVAAVDDVQAVATEAKVTIADVPAELSAIGVKVYVPPVALSASSDENLPIYDADTSETQSYGLYKVIDVNGSERTDVEAPRADEELSIPAEVVQTVAAAEIVQPAVKDVAVTEEPRMPTLKSSAPAVVIAEEPHTPALTPIDPVVVVVAEELPALTPVAPAEVIAEENAIFEVEDIVSATEIADAELNVPDSTELWTEQYTQSLYDGGSTIDDNVEVNAIVDGDEVTVGPTEPSVSR